ncbi:MAG: MarR family transcriptional regulator [Gammaproteobacteria bacterium HGW-Gammaproteobacteria-3]|jgi:DNA-binding MarR family transcriptional regulator|nr:MAG: MarR family transcriptional regulator [Gammaproteobacteria bacterium HGW-Gammaproteobacteria-3]
MQDSNIFNLIDRISTLLRSEERKKYTALGLQPIHGQILDYLSKCNKLSDTPAAVTEYFGLTKGTVSQSLQVLERKGYLEKNPNTQDRRIVHLKLSESGERLLLETRNFDLLPDKEQAILAQQSNLIKAALISTLTALQKANNLKSFGICHTCTHFSEVERHYFCGLTRQPLSQGDVGKICREHALPV